MVNTNAVVYFTDYYSLSFGTLSSLRLYPHTSNYPPSFSIFIQLFVMCIIFLKPYTLWSLLHCNIYTLPHLCNNQIRIRATSFFNCTCQWLIYALSWSTLISSTTSHVVSFPTVSQRMIHSVALHIESFKWMLYRILDRVAISE